MATTINLFVIFFITLINLLFFVSCNFEKKNYYDALKIDVSGPIRNDTIITEDGFKEIKQRFSFFVENIRRDSVLFIKTIKDNTEIAPYAIEYTKVFGDSLIRRQGIADLWGDKYLRIEPKSKVKKHFDTYFFSNFDTLHLFFKYKSVEKSLDKSVQVSYVIKNGKLSKKIGTKYFE